MPEKNCLMRKIQNFWLLYLKGFGKYQTRNFQPRSSYRSHSSLQRLPDLQEGLVSSVSTKPEILNWTGCEDHRLGCQRRTDLLACWEQLGRRLGRKWYRVLFLINLDAFWSTKMSFKSKDSQLLQLLTLKTLRLKKCKKEKLKQWTSKENRLNCDRYIQTFWKYFIVIQMFLAGLVFH